MTRANYMKRQMFFLMALVLLVGYGCWADSEEETSPGDSRSSDTTSAITATPVPTATLVPTATPAPSTRASVNPTRSSALATGLSQKDILRKTSQAMSGLESYRYQIDAVVSIEANGSEMEIPISADGRTMGEVTESILTITLLGFPMRSTAVQAGTEIYVSDSDGDKWLPANGLVLGLISPGFWTANGINFAAMRFEDEPEIDELDGEPVYIHRSGDGLEGDWLFSLLGAVEGAEDVTVEDAEMMMWIDRDKFLLRKIRVSLSAPNGGTFIAEQLGFTNASGLGGSTLELVLVLSEFGKDYQIRVPEIRR